MEGGSKERLGGLRFATRLKKVRPRSRRSCRGCVRKPESRLIPCLHPLARWRRHVVVFRANFKLVTGPESSSHFNSFSLESLLRARQRRRCVLAMAFPRLFRISSSACRDRNRLLCRGRRRIHKRADHQLDAKRLSQHAQIRLAAVLVVHLSRAPG